MFNAKAFVKYIVLLIKKKIDEGAKIDKDRAFSEIEFLYSNLPMLKKLHDMRNSGKKGKKNTVNSYIAYILGITSKKPDGPFKPKLSFELARVSHPDIDIDFDFFYRDNVYTYLIEKYGREFTGNIGTYQRLKAKNSLRTAIKTLDPYNDKEKSLEFENYVAKLVPDDPKIKLKDAIDQNSELDRISKTKRFKDVFYVASILEGNCSYSSRHAAGIVVSDSPIGDVAPLQRTAKGEYATQYEMAELEDVGLIKFDILSLKTLSVFTMLKKDLKDYLDIDFDIDKIPYNDNKALKLIAQGKTDTVFQLESGGMKELLREMKVSSFEDVAAANALHRPGAMSADADSLYCECKHGEREITYDHKLLEPILKETYGQIIYQEQCQLIAIKLAGFTRKEADKLRKAIGKKQGNLFHKIKTDFVRRAKQISGMEEDAASVLFQKIENMGGYAFCMAHAYAYAVLAMQSAYLKAHYPLYYMKSVLNSEVRDTKIDNVERYMRECLKMGLKILPCNVNKSKKYFSIEKDKIRRPLLSLKGVGEKASSEISELSPFKSFEDFVERTDGISVINKSAIEVLMENGAFADFKLYGERGLDEYLKLRNHVQYMKKKNIQKSSMFDLTSVSF